MPFSLVPLSVSVFGWRTSLQNHQLYVEKAKESQNLWRVKIQVVRAQKQWRYSRPQKIIGLEELHPKCTQSNCVPEARDCPIESVLPMNFYMGDANQLEEEIEEPPKYVPPPSLDQEDAEMIEKTENVLYAVKDFLCCWAENLETNWRNCNTVWKLFSRTVEYQDPLICFRGLKSLIWWLEALSDATFSMNIDEIYSENQAKGYSKPQVYIIWTMVVMEDQERCFRNLGVWDWWREKYMALLQELHMLKDHSGRLQLSGETKLEIDSLGQISSICTSWYSTRDEPKQLQGFVRLLLVALLSRRA